MHYLVYDYPFIWQPPFISVRRIVGSRIMRSFVETKKMRKFERRKKNEEGDFKILLLR